MGISRTEVNLRRLLAAAPQQQNQAKLIHVCFFACPEISQIKDSFSNDLCTFFLLVWRVRSEYFGCFILFWSLLKHVLYLGVWKFELNNLIDKTVFFVSLASLIACYVWLYLSGIGSVIVWFFVLIYMYMYIHLPFLIDNQWNFAVCCYFTRTIRTIDWRENSRRITKVCLLTLFFPSYSVLLWEANIC